MRNTNKLASFAGATLMLLAAMGTAQAESEISAPPMDPAQTNLLAGVAPGKLRAPMQLSKECKLLSVVLGDGGYLNRSTRGPWAAGANASLDIECTPGVGGSLYHGDYDHTYGGVETVWTVDGVEWSPDWGANAWSVLALNNARHFHLQSADSFDFTVGTAPAGTAEAIVGEPQTGKLFLPLVSPATQATSSIVWPK